ncbi:hypothetical protein GCM10029976_047590 [Kribbella albertanoniae]|uniref:Uncharacterized protein n=1 Tax=Kribbella albertanoniae TaxID=1266829 RepID=A0A4R4Q3S6_9ACTN|nr:hypothetical protein [Kribbella albertanoniae]TDC29726.1 hypothetical protein E1261_15010 [Kribbella albertanoniae]
MSTAGDRDPIEALQAPIPVGQGDAEKRRDYRLMGFATALALLVLLAMPWLTTWGAREGRPTRVYSGIRLIKLYPDAGGDSAAIWGASSAHENWLSVLFIAYLLLAVTCLIFPATAKALTCSCLGFVVTVVIILAKPDSYSPGRIVRHHVDWTGASTMAAGIWLVSVFVAYVGWSARRR